MPDDKKVIAVVILSVVLAAAFLLYNNHHFIGDSVCGSGLYGIKLLMVYLGLVLLVFVIFWLLIVNKPERRCLSCKSGLEEEWKVCPYCGLNVERTGM
jgi:rRNA maturation endonuclease Nob1